jgi:hypothetical protein
LQKAHASRNPWQHVACLLQGAAIYRRTVVGYFDGGRRATAIAEITRTHKM